MNSPIIASEPGSSAGRVETVVPNTTSLRPVSWARTTAQAPWSTLFIVSLRLRAAAVSSAVNSSDSSRRTRSGSAGVRSAVSATRVGPSRPASACRQARSDAPRSCLASHPR